MKFPGNMGGMGQLLQQAQKMQAEMKQVQAKLAEKELDVESAGGRIKIKINGKQEILKIDISAELVDPNDVALLADMVKVAVNEAVTTSQNMVATEMGRIVPPGLSGLF
ncbi:MAG: YbaB/EbfC family nucleoid-associated protein [Proteobacteria bacterium]|jgi:DNA-binding YbaB/EbfC family protein|nr:YbaB/EbfC family nucleoid-associated protein [Pseudomonadota bacterium]